MRVTVRPAVPAELPRLQAMLFEQRAFFEQQDLSRAVVYVAEFGGEIVGFCAARLVMQVEPLLLDPVFTKHAPRFAQAKATLGLISAIDGWIASPDNKSGVRWYFCSIVGKRMQQLALHFGMYRTYIKSKFFSRKT
jgi:hypothetical protein